MPSVSVRLSSGRALHVIFLRFELFRTTTGSIAIDQLVEVGSDNFVNSPSDVVPAKQVGEADRGISVPSDFRRICNRTVQRCCRVQQFDMVITQSRE
jgi:hypothetical protein